MKCSRQRWSAFLALVVLLASLMIASHNATAGQEKPLQSQAHNQLSEEEKKAGWKLLFDGQSFDGWHNFKKDGVKPGWKIMDGTLVCAEPKKAGDLVTNDQFDWFELSLEFNIAEGSNSGIMIHVTNEGDTIWATGPEIQLLDNKKGGDPQRCGWLYQLYKPANDTKTNQPIDATKPAGEWNQIRIVIASPPAKSAVVMNGVKYFDFVWNGEDFKDRIAKSKFKTMANFAKSDSGFIGLQGDHGVISFRNIKLLPLGKEAAQVK
jgi:hypothetical protein